MENLLCIKGKIIGKGKPLVCVPVMESSKEEILRETRRLEEAQKSSERAAEKCRGRFFGIFEYGVFVWNEYFEKRDT